MRVEDKGKGKGEREKEREEGEEKRKGSGERGRGDIEATNSNIHNTITNYTHCNAYIHEYISDIQYMRY